MSDWIIWLGLLCGEILKISACVFMVLGISIIIAGTILNIKERRRMALRYSEYTAKWREGDRRD